MSPGSLATIAAWSYGIAAAGYLALAVRIILGWSRSVRAALLLAATLITALWGLAGVAVAVHETPATWIAVDAADTLRYTAWYAFLATLLVANAGPRARIRRAVPRWAIVVAIAGLGLSLGLSVGLPLADALGLTRFGLDSSRLEFGVRVGLAVFGLTLVEQLIRRAGPEARWTVKPLCVALAGVFGYELFLYADGLLFGRLDADIVAAHGIVNALVIPFFAVAMARNPGWKVEMHVSRDVAFQSTALLISGAFLVAVAVAGYLLRYVGGDWGKALQIEILFAAVLCIVFAASSGRVRAKLRVFVSKHFFSYRYDYRREWLRFTGTLSNDGAVQDVQERVIIGLATLVESPAGMLWLKDQARDFRVTARWNMAAVRVSEPGHDSLVEFLQRTGWVVSVEEAKAASERYPGLILPEWLGSMQRAWLITPLLAGTELLGFVVLATPRAAIKLDWEVRDLLKTASRQAASYLGEFQAAEALLEARKFDAFNRMSAFVVHDLKNLVAQLSLMLRNAERHRDNPEFQLDMFATVRHVVEQMNKLMLQLRTSAAPVESLRPVDLGVIVRRVCATKASNDGKVDVNVGPESVVVLGHEERLEHVIGHLLQNALDATASRGRISLRLGREDRHAIVEVDDTGVGMSPEFMRQQLLKPFQTTKPTGMGIGVYESSQYVTALGGEISFDSTPNVGTKVRIRVPLAGSASNAPARLGEAA